MSRRKTNCGVVAVIIGVLCACGANGPAAITPEEAEATAREAYVYGFPMVMGYKTLYTHHRTGKCWVLSMKN